jgi:MFS family permease
LRQQTAFQAGSILAMQALTTLAILPIGGRLADKLGPVPVVIAGLSVFAGAAVLMTTLTLDTPVWMIVGILILPGCAFGLTQQLPVAAMSQIEKDERQEVANGSTLITVLHATAAPLGVALLSSLVQARSQQYTLTLATQGVTGELLNQQSLLLAMHESFLVASFLALGALVAMGFVPRRRDRAKEQPDHGPVIETGLS